MIRQRLKGIFEALPKVYGFQHHCLTLLPLVLTYVLQRSEHLVDNRFMSTLGLNALSTHSVFYNFFLIGQALGAATATSALVLWRRQEFRGSQGTILRSHIVLAAVFAGAVALMIFPLVPNIASYFSIPGAFSGVAIAYLGLGLVNLVLQAIYGALNAMLIASDQRVRSMLYISALLGAKLIVGTFAVKILWNGSFSSEAVRLPMLVIGGFSLFSLSILGLLAYRAVGKKADGWNYLPFRAVTQVWWSEVGIAAVRASAPILFCFQLAKVVGSDRFFVTYQLALQLAYFLVLPLQAGAQLAVRDASHAQSLLPEERLIPLGSGKWFGNYLFAALLPAEVLLFVGSLIPVSIIHLLFGYSVPKDHQAFLSVYFLACMIGQIGNFMVIRLRSLKKNSRVTRNALVSEIMVQLGLMQLCLFLGVATPTVAGFVTLAYCCSHLTLNGIFAWRLRWNRPAVADKRSFPGAAIPGEAVS